MRPERVQPKPRQKKRRRDDEYQDGGRSRMDRLEQLLDELDDDDYDRPYEQLYDDDDDELLDDFDLYDDEETGTLPPVLLSIQRTDGDANAPVTVKLHTQATGESTG
jgi:hypothetical protein